MNAVHDRALELTDDFAGCPQATRMLGEVAVQGARYCQAGNDPEVSSHCCGSPRGNQGRKGPSTKPGRDQWVAGGAVR